MSDSSDDDFGQKLPPLHIYLKRVLDKYPEGGQILKELVQNADDAEAKEVIFLYDKTEHPRSRLWSDKLQDFQGPALYAYNDATFQKTDWNNIQHPEQSDKLDDLSKVGRFGLGFISVYHLTDMPCVLSGNRIGFLDPLEQHFNYNPHTNTRYNGRRGKKWKMSADLLEKFPDQFSPFLHPLFKCEKSSFKDKRFNGTIFRFPLRRTPSLISKSVFDDERVHRLFKSFERDAVMSLLFLKHVESISVYERHNMRDNLICKVQITPNEGCCQLRLNRSVLLGSIPLKQDCQKVSCIDIVKSGNRPEETSRYITVNTLQMTNTSQELQRLTKDDDLRLLPWMGVSCRIRSTSAVTEQDVGRTFCFLPLPEDERTGLPVHVHGYFGLGDNRRSIKWPDAESLHDDKARWNELLLSNIFPSVYAKVILVAIDKSKDPHDPVQPADVYKGWPSKDNIQPKWQVGVRKFIKLMTNEAFVFIDNTRTWMKLKDVYIVRQRNPLISKVMQNKGQHVAHLPHHVVESLSWAEERWKEVTPAVVRQYIRGDHLTQLSRNEKLQLLDYVTSDTFSDLTNLWLLPLQNGEFTCFSGNAQKVYIENSGNPSSLIPNSGLRFASHELPMVCVQPNTQLKHFSFDDVLPLLKEMLPSTWRGGSDDTLQWTPGQNQHPSKQWLVSLWKWLSNNHQNVYLGSLSGVPLIPLPQNRIARLQERMIFRERKSYSWHSSSSLTTNICSFIESLQTVVVCPDDLYSDIIGHPHLSNFIKEATPDGVLEILHACSSRVDIQRVVANSRPEVKDELRDLLAQTTGSLEILRGLPLFQASNGQYVSVQTCSVAVQKDYFGLPVRTLRYLRLWSTPNESDNLLTRLCVNKETVSDLVINNILPAVNDGFYSDRVTLEIMKWVLLRGEFDSHVRVLKFVPTRGSKAKPEDLFEPTGILPVLLKNRDVFPTGMLSEGRMLNYLKRVGLKQEADVSADDILQCAEEVSRSQANNRADTGRASVLLKHINRYPHLLSERVTRNRITKPLMKFLEDFSWVPCEPSPPPEYPAFSGWAGKSGTLYKPKEVGLFESDKSALLQGSVMPLFKLVDIREEILNAFSWSREIDTSNYRKVEIVVRHLKNLAGNCQIDPRAHMIISRSVFLVYEFLSKASVDQLRDLFQRYFGQAQPWVWHGSGFTTATNIVFHTGNLGVSLVPYLHSVPEDFREFNDFLADLGVQKTFSEDALSTVLQNIKEKYTDGQAIEDDYEKDLHIVCNIVQRIVSQGNLDANQSDILVPCRVPTGRRGYLRMEPASECLYVDEERLASQIMNPDFVKAVIHESLPNHIAQSLRIKPLSHVLAPVESVDYGYDFAGPHETTVNAIRRNLDMYKRGVDIFKELIQNADDAGATEVKFLIDWRRNANTACDLLSDGMKACHGPALWAYNDASFSDDDFKNICSIAAQSKRQQLDKIGRFGLGFTSVYHLTDVPSIVSGPYVLICDPLTTHLGSRIKPEQPGIKLDLRKEDHKRTVRSYPNQFRPYDGIFDCKPTESSCYDHTLIRLPFRTHLEASQNQLCEYVCDTKKEIDPLIESLKKSANTLLLFTQNVLHVSVYELQTEKITDWKKVMSVSIKRAPEHQMPRPIHHPQNMSECPRAEMKKQRNLLKATTECVRSPDGALPQTTMIVEVTHETCPTGRNLKGKPKTKTTKFIISSCMVKGSVLDLALSPEGQHAAVLPCGGVAAELKAGDQGLTPLHAKGSVFSYLPLDVASGLPFHVNGNFLLQPNRRQLWSRLQPSSGSGEFEIRWNTSFMESVLLSSFMNLLEDLKELQGCSDVDNRSFQCLWPTRTCQSDFFPFVDAFYRQLGSNEDAPAVMFSHNQWVSVNDCFFIQLKQSEGDSKCLKESIIAILSAHLRPKRYVDLNSDVLSSIVKAGANRRFDENTYDFRRFLKEVFFPVLQSEDIDPIHRNRVVLHILDGRLSPGDGMGYDDDLESTYCIPISPLGDDLARPDYLVNPHSNIGTLYDEDDGRFPHGDEFLKDARLLSLEQLGMAKSDLTWEDICERAESISADGIQDDPRSKTLLKLMNDKLNGNNLPDETQTNRLQSAAFLPVLKKPYGYPLDWHSCDSEMLSADMLHESRHKNLLGSVKPLLDENRCGSEGMSNNVKRFLGLSDKTPAINDVMRQLHELIHQTGAGNTVTTMACQIYSFLQKSICDMSAGGDVLGVRHEHRAVVDQLCNMSFVLCHGKFRECKQLAFDYKGHSGPYLFKVPLDLSQYNPLLRVCGVRDKFGIDDFIHTIHLLHQRCEDNPLTEEDFRTAKAMLGEILSCIRSQDDNNLGELQDVLQNDSVLVPDCHCILQKPSQLTYDDMPWVDREEDERYTHKDITRDEAKTFGIITRRDKSSEILSSLSGFEFGQREELTDRLRNILRSYPNVSDVFKEMLQNADDAGCTKIHFVYDPRIDHPTDKIITPTWSQVQKLPSLCVYNDRPFTDADIKGIQKVGVGGKRDEIVATGKFGIGFNAVYHLTDCPSFVSNGDTLCLFDPLRKIMPKDSSPGRMYKTNKKLRDNFPDMLTGYLEHIEQLDVKAGTMFRFPLRKDPSEISEMVFSAPKIKELFEDFKKVSQEALLFLQNIKTITVSCVDQWTNTLEQEYQIDATLTDEDERRRKELTTHLELYKDRPHMEIPKMVRQYKLNTEDTLGIKRSWYISQMLGFDGLSIDDTSSTSSVFLRKPIPRGGVAAPTEDVERHCKAYCLLPLPVRTNLPVHVNGSFELDAARKNLKKGDEYASEDEDGLIHRWNRLLVENVIGPAYAHLLKYAGRHILKETDARAHVKKQLQLYDNLFPKNPKELKGEWLLLAKATLRYVNEEDLDVLPVVCSRGNQKQINWHPPKMAYFDGFERRRVSEGDAESLQTCPENMFKLSPTLSQFLLKVGFNLLATTPEICLAFKACGIDDAKFVSPQAVVQHLSAPDFTSTLPKTLKETAFGNVYTFREVFQYSLRGISRPIDLNGLPLRLTNDDTLGVFSASEELYVTPHCRVLPCVKERFLHEAIVPSCIDWLQSKKTQQEAFSCGVFKEFTLHELARYLVSHLPENWQGCAKHVLWEPAKGKQHPSETWLRELWTFICSETSGKQASLEALNNWPIFPTVSGKLVPPSLAKTLLLVNSLSGDGIAEKIFKVLRDLGLPEVSQMRMFRIEKIWPTGGTGAVEVMRLQPGLDELLKNHLAKPQCRQDVVGVIRFMLTNGGVKDISPEQCYTLLRYFQEDDSLSEECLRTIKQLKIFKLLGRNETTDLQRFDHYHTVEGYEILTHEASRWMDNTKCVFLEPQRLLLQLFDQLQVSAITHADIYLKYILPSFPLLDHQAKFEHIKHIDEHVLPKAAKCEKEAIIELLSCTPFILDRTNTFRPASYFFDTNNRVFKELIDPGKMLPDLWKHLHWFLEKLGFHTEVSRDEFITFAKEVEARAKKVKNVAKREKLAYISKLLTNELDLNDSLIDPGFLQTIAKIEFVPSVKINTDLLQIHPAACGSSMHEQNIPPFIAYHGSVPEKDLELVWSVCMVLPRETVPRERKIEEKITVHGCLGIERKAVNDKVFLHVQNVCDLMVKRNAIHKEDTLPKEVRETLESVLNKILRFIDHAKDHPNEIKRRLQSTPLCLVDDRRVLVRADQLVFSMETAFEGRLWPYLHKAPRELSQFDSVLRLLGAQDTLSFDQLAGMLSTMEMKCKDSVLDPNEKKSAVSAVTALFSLLVQGECKISVPELYLPSSEFILKKASTLHYVDPHKMGLLELASTDKEFIFPLKECQIPGKDEVALISLLPETLRPKDLGADLQKKPCETNVDCVAGDNCEYVEHIRWKLNSEEMTRALLRLVHHQLGDKKPTEDVLTQIAKVQSFDRFHCKKELRIALFDKQNKEIAKEKSSRHAYFDTITGNIYLKHLPVSDLKSRTCRQIANSCNILIGNILNHEHIGLLVDALGCQSLDDMNTELSDNSIPEYDITTQAVQQDMHRPGTTVPSDIRHLLDQDPYNRFFEDEIVAYERSIDDTSQEGTDIVYAKIIEQIDKDSSKAALSKTFKIDVGRETPIIVKVTALYKFLRPEPPPDMSVAPFTGEIKDEVPGPVLDENLPEDAHNDEEQIRRELDDAFEVPQEERGRVLKRLFRKWHPDKNIGQEERANKAFKFLKEEIARREQQQEKSGQRWSARYDTWESGVRRQREEARSYQEKYYQRERRNRENSSGTNFVPPSFTRETPEPRTARLWFRQANEHFDTAEVASQQRPCPSQLIAFQVHQAAETALKAAQYSLSGKPDLTCNSLRSLATKVAEHEHVSCSDDLMANVDQLEALDCTFHNPRYPNNRSSKTSGQAYHDFDTKTALQICKGLLDLVRDIIGIQPF